MGLIKAAMASANSTFADQWKEYFIADAMDSDTLMVKGYKQQNGNRTSNTKGSEDIITDGSIIAINEGQAMIVVTDGKIAEFSAEPGAFQYSSETESSIFQGGLGSGILNTFKTIGRRFQFGGDTAANSKVYYFNLKELSGNKFGTSEPIMYDDYVYQSISLRFFGQATLKLEDPMLFYTSIAGNVEDKFSMADYWARQLKSEFVMYLSQATALLAADHIKYNQITQKQVELAQYMNTVLDEEWVKGRGLVIGSVGIESISLDPEDKAKIEKIDEMRLMSNPANAAGRMTAAAANAMETAAGNENGAMMGFAGFNMAAGAGNAQVTGMHQMAAESGAVVTPPMTPEASAATWTCECGAANTGKFCTECGNPKPVANGWTCECGTVNTGKFCTECGTPKPVANSWTCECGTVNEGKFCTNCGAKHEKI